MMVKGNRGYSNNRFLNSNSNSSRINNQRASFLTSYYSNLLIRYKKNEMRWINEQIKNKKRKELTEVEVEVTEINDDEKIGINIFLHLLMNNIKDDFKEDICEIKEQTCLTTRDFNSDRILVIISCHTDSRLRLQSIQLIMHALKEVENIDIIIVNSKGLTLSHFVKDRYKSDCIGYYEIRNDQYYGFSKWYYGLIQTEFMKYKFITFINDSILIHQPIKHFFEYTRFKNVDLYGFNDSSQITHHYQSYFFSVKNTAIINFLKMFDENKRFVHSYMDAVFNLELRMFQYFSNRDCFLKIAYFPFNREKNIFSQNDALYFKLRHYGILPFTKLKRISRN